VAPPNLDAVELLADVAAALPRLLIISADRTAWLHQQVVPPNLVFAGMVSDRAKAKLLAAADVALNPMRTGSGTNLKLIEYLAAGVPVVSTGFGVRGVDVDDGRHLLVADPDRFADAVAASLADPPAAATRAARGRVVAAEGYGWPALGARFAEVVAGVIGDRASRPHV
jgi:glycosyltransferase involved in cell wall biosynthesis